MRWVTAGLCCLQSTQARGCSHSSTKASRVSWQMYVRTYACMHTHAECVRAFIPDGYPINPLCRRWRGVWRQSRGATRVKPLVKARPQRAALPAQRAYVVQSWLLKSSEYIREYPPITHTGLNSSAHTRRRQKKGTSMSLVQCADLEVSSGCSLSKLASHTSTKLYTLTLTLNPKRSGMLQRTALGLRARMSLTGRTVYVICNM